MSLNEPTDAEIASGGYRPYRSHPANAELQPYGSQPEQNPAQHQADAAPGNGYGPEFVLAVISLVIGVPITAIASTEGLLGMAVAWAGIVGVNAVHAGRRRKR